MPEYDTWDIICALPSQLRASGLAIMNLLFLIQYDVDGKRVIKYYYNGKPITRGEFFIWGFGPMSNEVYDAIGADEPCQELPGPVLGRVNQVINQYASYNPRLLRRLVLGMLGLGERRVRRLYLGYLVDDYFKLLGFELVIRDLGLSPPPIITRY